MAQQTWVHLPVPADTSNDVARCTHTEQLEATMVAVGNGPSLGGGSRVPAGAGR